jgi:hypothetical protein
MTLRKTLLSAITATPALLWGLPCAAQTAAASTPSSSTPTGMWERTNLLGDIGGLRTILGELRRRLV